MAWLGSARYWHDRSRTLAPGEAVRALHFTIDWADEDVFFLDDVEVSSFTP